MRSDGVSHGSSSSHQAELALDGNPFSLPVLHTRMTENDRTELRNAAEKLSEARNAASDPDAGERLESLAEQVEKMADADRGPDHGRLARLEHNLQDVQKDLDAEAADLVDEALSHERAYRETVEGV